MASLLTSCRGVPDVGSFVGGRISEGQNALYLTTTRVSRNNIPLPRPGDRARPVDGAYAPITETACVAGHNICVVVSQYVLLEQQLRQLTVDSVPNKHIR